MTDTPLVLRGLQPQPLATYLAALGLLRVCCEQLDPSIRGAWTSQGFALYGTTEDAIVSFLASDYRPTPLVAPWAGGSGFAEGEDREALDAICASPDVRLESYRRVIEQVLRFKELPPQGWRVQDVDDWAKSQIESASTKKQLRDVLIALRAQVVNDGTDSKQPINSCKQGTAAAKIFTQLKSQLRASAKGALAARCRNELPDECLGWIDTSIILFVDADGEMDQVNGPMAKDAMKPKLEFSRLYMQAVCGAILRNGHETQSSWIRAFLLDGLIHGLPRSAGGLFELGSAGGFNMGPGFEHKDLANNPWRTLFTFEGVVLWSGSVSRRAGVSEPSATTVGPFTAQHVAAGAGNVAEADRKPGVIELWAPLWGQRASAAEVGSLISEGRVRVRGREARNGLDFAEAVSSLGADRGLTSFVRFAITERRGPSYVAAPVGEHEVREVPETRLLSEFDRELRALDAFLREFPSKVGPPAQLVGLRRAIDDARFDVAVRGGPDAMTRLVRAIGALEMWLSRRDPGKKPQLKRPLGRLSSGWVDACGDAPEVRIAAAVASIDSTGGAGPVRCYLAQVDPSDAGRWAPASRSVAWVGPDLATRLGNVLRRRVIDVRAKGSNTRDEVRNPTFGRRPASGEDIALLLVGDALDERVIEELIFGFTWVSHDAKPTRNPTVDAPPLSRAYALLKLLFLPRGIPVDDDLIAVLPDASIVPLLLAGRIGDAVDVARRQLVAKGLRPRHVVDPGTLDAAQGRLLAAALLIPIASSRWLVQDALMPKTKQEQETTDAR